MRHTLPLLLLLACCATSTKPEVPAAQPPASPALLAPEPPPGLRLPSTLKALAQRVELTIVPSSHNFEGTTELEVELSASTDVLWLNAKGLTVQKAWVQVGAHETGAQIFTSPERLALRLPTSPSAEGPPTPGPYCASRRSLSSRMRRVMRSRSIER